MSRGRDSTIYFYDRSIQLYAELYEVELNNSQYIYIDKFIVGSIIWQKSSSKQKQGFIKVGGQQSYISVWIYIESLYPGISIVNNI
jgi:hypothetical protein